MTISLALMAQPHQNAVYSIVQEALKPDVGIHNLVIGFSEVRVDGDVNLPIYIDSDAYSNPSWVYRGSVVLRHRRVDLQTALGGLGLRFRSGSVFHTEDAIARIASVLQLHFEPTDYIHDAIPMNVAGQFIPIRAAPDSPRWKGQVNIFVYR
jgi:hypothetical protein